MTKQQAVDLLIAANKRADLGDVRIYVDAWAEYTAAQANIDEHGTIVQHPRTGAPITNPYIVVRDKAAVTMGRIDLKTDDLWRA